MEPKDLIPQLRDLSEVIESHYKDMCDFEFTVQEGKFYLLNARIGKRKPQAALRIATDMFLEGKISAKTLVRRIDPDQIRDSLAPVLVMNSTVRELGNGVPASSGAAAGVAVFSAGSALELGKTRPAILLRPEVVPDDIHGMEVAVGIATFQGGMTSHAALVCRGMGKPCVTGLGWSFNPARTRVITPRGNIREGGPIAIDGSSGVVYAGRPGIREPKAFENDRLLLLFRLIDALSAENELPDDHIGKSWRIRDLMLYGPWGWNRPDPNHRLKHRPVGVGSQGKAFAQIRQPDVRHLALELSSFRLGDDPSDTVEIWIGLRSYLLRLLSKNVGLGRHPEFRRPLFDPCETVISATKSSGWGFKQGSRIQLVGEEFFSINFHVPELIDIATIRIYWAVQCDSDAELWCLDPANPRGETLLQGSWDLKALKVVVNDATVPQTVLGTFYNALRRREYYWDWYRANNISRREIIDALKKPHAVIPPGIRDLVRRAGLLSDTNVITGVGESLLRPSSAAERARLPVRVGW
jgi:phosphohistidine swiveling domain-containing protein